jgi:hypothetical protein
VLLWALLVACAPPDTLPRHAPPPAEAPWQPWSWRLVDPLHAGRAPVGTALVVLDLNLDGYDDVVVGTPGHAAVVAFAGSAGGPETLPSWTPPAPAEGFGAALAAVDVEQLGAGLATGDLDGDGRVEVLLGGPDVDNGEAGEGRVGVRSGLSGSTRYVETNEPVTSIGYAMATGDLDGDGQRELVAAGGVGCRMLSSGQQDPGSSQVFRCDGQQPGGPLLHGALERRRSLFEHLIDMTFELTPCMLDGRHNRVGDELLVEHLMT